MDRSHNPGFTMLEFYQALADVHDVMEVTEALVAHAVQAACGASRFTYQGQALDFTPPWPRLSMIEALGERRWARMSPASTRRSWRGWRAATASKPAPDSGLADCSMPCSLSWCSRALRAPHVRHRLSARGVAARAVQARRIRRWSSASRCSSPAWRSPTRSRSRTTPRRRRGRSRTRWRAAPQATTRRR